MTRTPNKAAAPNRRPALQFGRAAFIGRWLRCRSPFPAAVGELCRSAQCLLASGFREASLALCRSNFH
jgi:hypothetical protein